MSQLAAVVAQSIEVDVGSGSAECTLVLNDNDIYMYVANVASWIALGAHSVVTAAKTSGSMYVPANTPTYFLAQGAARLACLQDSTGGKASLTPVRFVR